MAEIERLTITLPMEMAAVIKNAVEKGDYASNSEVVRDALRDWKRKRNLQQEAFASLKADIDKGIADIEAGRVVDFDIDAIIEEGRQLFKRRIPSA